MFGFWGLEPLAGKVFAHLSTEKKTVAFAESCTGGLGAAGLTALAGSSSFFLGSAVVYSNGLKSAFLGVDPAVLNTYGAVSGQTALAMVRGLALKTGADYSLSVTGIAGPGGGSPEKPVGLVWFGWSGSGKELTWCRNFSGNRHRIQRLSVRELYKALLDGPPVDSA